MLHTAAYAAVCFLLGLNTMTQHLMNTYGRQPVTFAKGEKEGSLPMIGGSASMKGKTLFLTLTNCHATQANETTVNLLGGGQANGAAARVLAGEIHAHNTFEQPETIQPDPFTAKAEGASFTVTLPPASVVALEINLA